MAKQKTRKSAAKRFRLTKTGKVLRGHQHSSHLKRKKSKSQKRRTKKLTELRGRFKRKIKKMLAAS